MDKKPREDYRQMARKVAFDQKVLGPFGYVSPTTYDTLPPLSAGKTYTMEHVFHAPAETLETYKADITQLAHLCEICSKQFPQHRPGDFAWTIQSLNEAEARKLREHGKADAQAGDLHVRMRTGSFEDYAKFAYAFAPDETATTKQNLSRRIVNYSPGRVEQVETKWAEAVHKSLGEAKIPYRHSAEPDGTQKFAFEGPYHRPALILEGMFIRGAFDRQNSPLVYPALKSLFARLPDNFGAVTLQNLQKARRKAESRKGWFRPFPKVDTYRLGR